jgi:hypothetical protein
LASVFRVKGSKATISDLAQTLALSLCTVSKIFDRSFDGFSYAPETVTRVEVAAKKMGYRPKPVAQSLRTRKSKPIGGRGPFREATIGRDGARTSRTCFFPSNPPRLLAVRFHPAQTESQTSFRRNEWRLLSCAQAATCNQWPHQCQCKGTQPPSRSP